ncbi:MAG TPA: endonuclease domain-containing protein [Parvibaculum sp.]|jgi:very-short-patch-repair endonuclease
MPDNSIQHARNLRVNQTDAEKRLWSHLRNRAFFGFKFRRQAPIGPFIVDFLCEERKLIVELDGGQHGEQAEADARRSGYLQAQGYRVNRFWNNDTLANTEGVLTLILAALREAPHPPTA